MFRVSSLIFLLSAGFAFSACFEPESVQCGEDGPLCPPGWVCIAELTSCINPQATLCGNGVLDEGEECDDGNLLNHDGCNWDCTLPRCGDGFLDAPEVCDDGNRINGDGCSSDCMSEEVCGDGVVNSYPHLARDEEGNLTSQVLPPEQCDSGGVDTAECNADCTLAFCGDGKTNLAAGEECDGGNPNQPNPVDTDSCTRNCTISSCGDGYTNIAAGEQCDNGLYCADGTSCQTAADCIGIGEGQCVPRDFDCCTADCQNPLCGNGVLEPNCGDNPDAHEICDDGRHCADLTPCLNDAQCAGIGDQLCRTRNGTGCSANCKSREVCGDGILNNYAPYFELCDDGSHCSDGVTSCESNADCAGIGDEQCLPRNGTGCNSTCSSLEVCGDGILNNYPRRRPDGEILPPEVCDDGRQCADGTPCESSAECANVVGVDQLCRPRNATGCSNDCLSLEVCGDGIVNNYPHIMVNLRPMLGVETIGVPIIASEVCDDGKHCANLVPCDFDQDCAEVPGTDQRCVPRNATGCSADCLSLEVCGDGYFNDYSHFTPDGSVLPAEVCDDGNNIPGDGCSPDCSSTEQCGNGVLDPGEECDDGDLNGTPESPNNCARTCTVNQCGNGRVDPGEQCDDGNDNNEDNCLNNCTFNVCGDFFVNRSIDPVTGLVREECDEGGVNTEICNFNCTFAVCGDGIINFQAGESCDEGPPDLPEPESGDDENGDDENGDDENGGDENGGDENGGENGEADEPVLLGSRETDRCNTDCSIAFCGDGILNITRGEVCDDGNNVSGDGCSADCLSAEVCGDAIVNAYPHVDSAGNPMPPEVCDNGRHCSNGDACLSDADCNDAEGDCQVRGGNGCSADCLSNEVCGDSYLNDYAPYFETCDDGNDVSGDGCSGDSCQIEPGWACPVLGQPCFAICGDGLIVGDETCDNGGYCDGGDTPCTSDSDCGGGTCAPRSGDGCSDTCRQELGWECAQDGINGGPCEPVCGDFLIRGDEECDDGGTVSGNGCSSDCRIEAGWDCPSNNGIGGVCQPICGDGIVAGNEECDNGGLCDDDVTPCTSDAACGEGGTCTPRAGDGCSPICRTELGWECAETGGPCDTICGDFLIRGDEECDDGNLVNGDGCDANCQKEDGWSCPAGFAIIGGECTAICGDGLVRGAEECDTGRQCSDGRACDSTTECTAAGLPGTCRARGGDGCDSGCQIETGWDCEVVGGVNVGCGPICGDGLIRGAETCDEGAEGPSGGCVECVRQDGWACPNASGSGGLCAAVCGDLLIVGTETCDDGNTVSGDGCSSTCATEEGWTCADDAGAGGGCDPICGDGLIRGDETCDEGGNVGGTTSNGCVDCQAQGGWSCPNASGVGGTCETICGDGLVAPGVEQCDDGNDEDGDGCSSTCQIEPGWYCDVDGIVGGPCRTECGDGITAGDEECDQGTLNADNFDCTSQCRIATCEDGLRHSTGTGNESDIDCGGAPCELCGNGRRCDVNANCASGYCDLILTSGVCRTVPTVEARDDALVELEGDAVYVFSIDHLLSNDINAFRPSFEADVLTDCGGSVAFNLVDDSLTYTPPADPSNCSPEYVDTFDYSICSEFDASICDAATVTVTLNRAPTIADATSCVPVGAASASFNVTTAFTDPDGDDLRASSIAFQTPLPAGGSASRSGTSIVWTPSAPATAASYAIAYEGCDDSEAPGCDAATWTAVWNDPPVLADLASTPLQLGTELSVEVTRAQLISSTGVVVGVPDGDDPIASIRVGTSPTGPFSTSVTTARGSCSADADGVTYLAGATTGADACWIEVCETCGVSPVCSRTELRVEVVTCLAVRVGDADIGCTSSAPVCDESADGGPACVQCLSTADCPGTEKCQVETNLCRQCLSSSDCSTPTPSCNLSTFTCSTCSNTAPAGGLDDGCEDPAPTCRTSGGPNVCVQCLANADCERRSDEKQICRTGDNTCVECTADSQCEGNGGSDVCEDNVCVQCRSNDQCGGATPQCDTTDNTCVECFDSALHCTDEPETVCRESDRTCVQCEGNSDCGDQLCDVPSGVCVGCLVPADCATSELGTVCGVGGVCGCSDDTHCLDGVCDTDANVCVTCDTGTNAGCEAPTPICAEIESELTCVACTEASDCGDPGDGWACTDNACVAPGLDASDDTFGYTLGGGEQAFAVALFLNNDSSADAATFSLPTSATDCTGSSVVLNVDEGAPVSVTYTPPADAEADCTTDYVDAFTYEVCSAFDSEACETAVVTVLLNRAPSLSDFATCVATGTPSALVDVIDDGLFTDPDGDGIGAGGLTVTTQPTDGVVTVPDLTELLLTPDDASVPMTYVTALEACDDREADFWSAGCDTATWTAVWNDPPTLADLSGAEAVPVPTEGVVELPLAMIVEGWGLTITNEGDELASLEVSDAAEGPFGVGAVTTGGGGSCAVVDGEVVFTASETVGTDTCFVRVCEVCGSDPVCATTAVEFAVAACVKVGGPGDDPDPGCDATTPRCDDTADPIACVTCADDSECGAFEMCDAGSCVPVDTEGRNLLNGTFTGGWSQVVEMAAYNDAVIFNSDLAADCSTSWRPQGTLCDQPPSTNSATTSSKSNTNSGMTWSQTGPAQAALATGVAVIDVGATVSFNELRTFQMFSDGKVTGIRFATHPTTGTCPAWDDGDWTTITDFESVPAGAIAGNDVTGPAVHDVGAQSTRCLRVEARNSGVHLNNTYISVRSIKMFLVDP